MFDQSACLMSLSNINSNTNGRITSCLHYFHSLGKIRNRINNYQEVNCYFPKLTWSETTYLFGDLDDFS